MPLATVIKLVPVSGDHLDSTPIAPVQGALALDLGRNGTPQTPEYDAHLSARLVALHESEVKAWTALFAQAVVETIGGDRPVTQLVRWTTASVYRDLERRVQLMRLARPADRPRTVRPQVRSVHVFLPAPGIAEVSVHVRHGHRSRAIAARLRQRRGRWVCSDLELG